MILRRVIAHFKKQEWTAIALDFLIVVVGVFVGLQVNNWNTARQNNNLAAEYLERLKVDLSEQIIYLERLKDYTLITERNAESAAASYRKRPDELGPQFLINLYQASQRWFGTIRKGTHDELVSTGRIVLIGDLETREMLRAHYAIVNDAMISVHASIEYRTVVRLEIDPIIQAEIRDKCGDVFIPEGVSFYLMLREECEIDAPQALIASDVAKLHADENVHKWLRFQIDVIDTRIATLDALIASSKEMRAILSELSQ